jgi:hypothetical protein
MVTGVAMHPEYSVKHLMTKKVPGTGIKLQSIIENVILSEGDKSCTEIDMVRLAGIIIS